MILVWQWMWFKGSTMRRVSLACERNERLHRLTASHRLARYLNTRPRQDSFITG